MHVTFNVPLILQVLDIILFTPEKHIIGHLEGFLECIVWESQLPGALIGIKFQIQIQISLNYFFSNQNG